MTPADAEALGTAWGATIAACAHAGDATAQRRARNAVLADVPGELRGAWWRGHDRAYRATWARLTDGEDISPHAWYARGMARRREEANGDE